MENWFGQLVSAYAPSVVTVPLSHIDQQIGATPAAIALALQGVTVAEGAPNHRVGVVVNGREIDEVSFSAQDRPVFHLALPPDVLQEGNNKISLIARGGESDISLIDYINIGYWHTYRADADQLLFTAEGQEGSSGASSSTRCSRSSRCVSSRATGGPSSISRTCTTSSASARRRRRPSDAFSIARPRPGS